MKKIFLLILCMFLLTGCSFFKSDMMEDIDIYTTTYPISYLIKYLYGEHSTIYSIYPSGVNFKEYELSDKKLNEFSKSSLFVFNSLDIDRDYAVKMVNVNSNLKLIDSSMGMEYNSSIEELWLNPYNYLMMAQSIRNGLLEYITNPYLISNKEKTGINNKYEELQYSLSKLDASYKDVFENAKYDTIVSSSDAIKFLEKYGITVISLEEDIREETITKDNTLNVIVNKYGINSSVLMTYNNISSDNIKENMTIKIPVKTIDTSEVNKVKKLISDGKIKYIYTVGGELNSTVKSLIETYTLGEISINTMYSVDGGIDNNNESYFTVMNSNLEQFKKEVNK